MRTIVEPRTPSNLLCDLIGARNVQQSAIECAECLSRNGHKVVQPTPLYMFWPEDLGYPMNSINITKTGRCYRELVLDAYPGSATEQWVHVPHVSEVGALSMLTRLELCGHTTYNSMFRRDVPDMPEGDSIPLCNDSRLL